MIKELLINEFSGGITDDPRDERENVATMVSNFNALTNKRRLIPYRDSESVTDGAGTSNIKHFCIALRTGTTYSIYGLGRETNQVYARISRLNGDITATTWTDTTNNVDASGTVNANFFVYYKKRARIFFGKTNSIGSYDPTGTAAFDDEEHALTFTNIGQGLVHSKDDILYVPYDNKIAKNNNNTWADTALTLPEHYVITTIAEYGDYLAIGAAHVDGVSNSRVFLWDRDSTLSTLSQTIDWGDGTLMILEEVDGVLVGISQAGGAASSFGTLPDATIRTKPRIIFRLLSNTSAIKFKELICDSTSTYLPIAKQKVDNRLYFNLYTTLYGERREGVWSIGRTPGGTFTLIHERTPNNDTATTSGAPTNFLIAGDYLMQAFTDNGTNTLTKSNDQSSFTATSIYESRRLDFGDASLEKDCLGVSVMFEYLPTAGQVVLKYKRDAETSWTTVDTEATDNAVFMSNTHTSSGKTLGKFKEIQFRIESTGNAVITGLHVKANLITSRIY